MAKLGRNERCPCGSGKKYKRCCGMTSAIAKQRTRTNSHPVTLTRNIEVVQQAATEKTHLIIEIGVFVLFSTTEGDSWLLELSDSDCIQLARKGETLEVPLVESPDVIEVDWSHTFAIKEKQFEIVGYKDKKKHVFDQYPTMAIAAAIKRIKKKFSPSQLENVHIDPKSVEKV